jgi:hypothetical protein
VKPAKTKPATAAAKTDDTATHAVDATFTAASSKKEDGEFAKPAAPAAALPPKKRGFFRSQSSQKSSSVSSNESTKTGSPLSAPPVLVETKKAESPSAEEAKNDETFLVPKPPSTPREPRETFVVPPSTPRETFVVVPQPSAAVVEAANRIAAAEEEGALETQTPPLKQEGEEEDENVTELQAAAAAAKFRFPGSLYKKRKSSTPVTSPKDRYGSLRSTNSEIVGRRDRANRSPVMR